MPYSVKGFFFFFFFINKEVVQILLMLELLFTQDSMAKNQGPVVQSIASLTSSLRGQLVKCFTTS